MITNLSNYSLNLVGYFKGGGKGLCNIKDLLLSKEHECFVVEVQDASTEDIA